MVAHAPWVPTMVPRQRSATMTVEEFMQEADPRNAGLVERIAHPTDHELVAESWRKTQEDIDRGIAAGPFLTMGDVPLGTFAVVIRKGIWERHGTATEYRVRNIDDFLVSEQNVQAIFCAVCNIDIVCYQAFPNAIPLPGLKNTDCDEFVGYVKVWSAERLPTAPSLRCEPAHHCAPNTFL